VWAVFGWRFLRGRISAPCYRYYDADDWKTLTKAIADGKDAVDAAATVSDVDKAKSDAVAAASAVKTKAQKKDAAAANAISSEYAMPLMVQLSRVNIGNRPRAATSPLARITSSRSTRRGAAQAESFVANAGRSWSDSSIRSLRPAVDVEWYGDKEQNPPEAEDVRRELRAFVDGVRPPSARSRSSMWVTTCTIVA
jgi:hypothetical protein